MVGTDLNTNACSSTIGRLPRITEPDGDPAQRQANFLRTARIPACFLR